MAIEILVDAKQENGEWKLVVNDGNPVEVPHGQAPQTIQWKLAGNAANGTFLAPGGAPPGFGWNTGEPPRNPLSGKPIFSAARRSPDEKELLVYDDNLDSGDQGEWKYTLRARIDGHDARSVEALASAPQGSQAAATMSAGVLVADPTIRNT